MAKTTHFFFRVTDSSQLNKVREGEVYQYQIPSVRESEVADFFLRDGRPGHGTDEKGFITDNAIKNDLQSVILYGWFEKSMKDDFSEPYVPKKERARLQREMERAVQMKDKADEQRQSESKVALPEAQAPAAAPASQPAAPVVTKKAPKAYQGVDTGTQPPPPQTASQRAEKQAKAKKKVILETDYNKFSEKELNNLYELAFKWIYGSDNGLRQALKKDIGEKIEEIDEFVDYGLAKKKVTDDEIPPMSYLERMPIIASNRELLIFYRRKLNRGAGAAFSKKVLFGGSTSFDVSSMPTTLRLGAAIGRLAFKGAVGGTSLAIAGIKAASKKIEEAKKERDEKKSTLEAKETSVSEKMQAPEARDVVKRTESVEPIKAAPAQPGTVLTPAMAKPNAVLGQKQEPCISSNMMKTLVDTLIQIKNYIKGKLIEDVQVKEAKNATFADITNKEAITTPPTAQSANGETVTKSESKGGLAELFKNMLNPMKLFGKALNVGRLGIKKFSALIESITPMLRGALKAIQGFSRAVGTVLRAISGTVANLAKSLGGGLLRGAASVLGTIVEGVGAVGAGTIAAGAAAVTGVAAAGQAIYSVATGGSGDNFISDALGVKNWFDAPTAERTPEQQAQIKALEKRHAERMQAVQKSHAQRLVESEQEKKTLTEAKEDKKTQQIVDASTKATTNVIQGGGGYMRPAPRTQDSTLQSILKLKSFYTTMPA